MYQNLVKFVFEPPNYSSSWLMGILSCNLEYSFGFKKDIFEI